MYEQVEKPKENKSKAVVNSVAQKKSNGKQGFGFVDNRPESITQRKQVEEMKCKKDNEEPFSHEPPKVVQRALLSSNLNPKVNYAKTDFSNFANETTIKEREVDAYTNELLTSNWTYMDNKAEGFYEWVISATNASRRYYAELDIGTQDAGIVGTTTSGAAVNIPGPDVAYGQSDLTDPDLTIHSTGPVRNEAIESKAINSADKSKVKTHINKALDQLDTRIHAAQFNDTAYTKWRAVILISNPENRYPWTNTEYAALVHPITQAALDAKMNVEIAKCTNPNTTDYADVQVRRQPTDPTWNYLIPATVQI